jgi:4-hydroxybenzoate polyprenyltransferase
MTTESRLRGVLALVRLPNLFTAPPDVLLGAALATSLGGSASVAPTAIAGACLASVLLYAAGTTLNDYADATADAADRPERPIPSDLVAERTALGLGVALLVAGPLVAGVTGGRWPGVTALAIAVGIAAYDGGLKDTPLGSPTMGLVRGTNVLLGVLVVARPDAVTPRLLLPAAAIALYITSVTFMAESETSVGASGAVLVAVAGTILAGAVGAIAAGGWFGPDPGPTERAASGLLLAGFLLWVGSALRRAYADPRLATVGPAVGTCVLGLVVFDAALAATVGVGWGLLVLAFLVPAVGFARIFDVS